MSAVWDIVIACGVAVCVLLGTYVFFADPIPRHERKKGRSPRSIP